MKDLTITENGMALELPEEFYTLAGLALFEGQLDIATTDRVEAMTRFAYHIHQILQNELWKLPRDEAGHQVYHTQDDYLEEHQARWRAGVSTMKQLHTTIRMARSFGYKSVQEILDRGGIYAFNEVRNRVKIDPKTGEVTALKAGDPPPGMTPAELAHEALISVSESQDGIQMLMPRDVKEALDKALVVGKPTISFARDRMQPLGDVDWTFSVPGQNGDEDQDWSGVVNIKWNVDGGGEVPSEVKLEFYRRLGVIS